MKAVLRVRTSGKEWTVPDFWRRMGGYEWWCWMTGWQVAVECWLLGSARGLGSGWSRCCRHHVNHHDPHWTLPSFLACTSPATDWPVPPYLQSYKYVRRQTTKANKTLYKNYLEVQHCTELKSHYMAQFGFLRSVLTMQPAEKPKTVWLHRSYILRTTNHYL